MFKLKGLIKMSVAVYLISALVIIACLSKISYDTLVVSSVRIVEVKQYGSNGVLAIAHYLPHAPGIKVGSRVSRIEGFGPGISCSFTGRTVSLPGDETADTTQYFGIYFDGLQHQDILRQMANICSYENIEVEGDNEPLFKKVTGQFLWKRKFH